MSQQQVEEVVDLAQIFKEFQEYRAEHPGLMSANALKVWLANGKKDRDGYKWKKYTERKRKAECNRYTGEIGRREESEEGQKWAEQYSS